MGFKIGEVVRFKDGDGRPHKIVDIIPHYPLNGNEHTFFEFRMHDGVGECFPDRIEYYKGDYPKYHLNKLRHRI